MHSLVTFCPDICLLCKIEQEALRKLRSLILGAVTIAKVFNIMKYAFAMVFAFNFMSYLQPITLAGSMIRAFHYSLQDTLFMFVVHPFLIARSAPTWFAHQVLALWRDIRHLVFLLPVLARITARLGGVLVVIAFLCT